MDVLIRTLPLHNANYGGILQNWALQYALKELGASVATDLSVRPGNPLRSSLRALVRETRRAIVPQAWVITNGDRRRLSNVEIFSFIDREISGVPLFRPWSRKPQKTVLSSAGCFVVGSDQVWRAKYGDVGSYLLDFLQPDDPRPRVAYAGSFGTEPDEVYEQLDRSSIQQLFGNLTAISCREQSGTDWVNALGQSAETMPDPTLLPHRTAYENLIRRANLREEQSQRPYLFAYVLDPTTQVMDQLSETAKQQGLELVVAGDAVLNEEGKRMGIEEWLRRFQNASAVVTDSFHGMVFSSIFGKRFAAVPNAKRGIDRFASFVNIYGLTDRLAADFDVVNAILDTPLPEDLSSRLNEARTRGLGFLKSNIGLGEK